MTEEYGFDSLQKQKLFSFPWLPKQLLGPLRLLYNGYLGLSSLGIKRVGREADQFIRLIPHPLYSREVKNSWSYISILHAYSWHRDNRTLLTLPLSCK